MTRHPRRAGTGALVAVLAVLVSLVVAAPAAHAAAPTVVVTSPAAGTITGTVGLSADVTSDPGDPFVSVAFVLDPLGTPQTLATSVSCATLDTSCTATGSFDFTGLSGDHTIVARVITASTDPGFVESDPVAVTVSTPAPTFSITSPTDGSTVNGVVSVSISASTDAALSDVPSTVALTLDGAAAGSADCTPASHTCTPSIGVDLTGLNGDHVLKATLTTTDNVTATDTVTVTVSNPAPTVSITAPGNGSTVVGPTGISVSASTGAKLTDYPASVVVVVDRGLPGQTTVGTVTCPGATVHSCTGTVSWDATGLTGSHTIDATLTTTRGLTAPSAVRTVTASTPDPTVSITSPTAGTSVSGTVVVTATAAVSTQLTEQPSSVALLVDGVQVDNQPCAVPLGSSCGITLSWDATGVTGDHLLKAVVTTTRGRTRDSATVTVPVTTPPYVVAVTSLTSGSVVVGSGATATSSGIVPVDVSASTGADQNEFPTGIELLVDGVSVAQTACPGSPQRTCTATLQWDARKAAGGHRIAARVTTSRGGQGTSPSVGVYARSGSKTGLTRMTPTVYGGIASIRGQVISTATGQALPGLWVKVTLAPVLGRARVVVVKTDINGRFLVRTRVYSNTRVTAWVGRNWLVSSSAVTVAGVLAPMTCSTTSSTYTSGTRGRGSCFVRALPVGTVVRLRYNFGGRWSTLASGRTSSTTVPFSFTLRTRGTYYLQVVVGASRVYVPTASRLMRVVIR